MKQPNDVITVELHRIEVEWLEAQLRAGEDEMVVVPVLGFDEDQAIEDMANKFKAALGD